VSTKLKTPAVEAAGAGPKRNDPKREPNMNNVASESNQASHETPPLLVAECPAGRVLTKRFDADGTKHDFSAGAGFRYHELPVSNWTDLVECLEMLTDQPQMCVLRAVLHPECPRADDDPDALCYRRKLDRPDEPANILPGAFPWVVFDFDDTAEPFDLAAPVQSIRAWHSTLKPELRAAASAFFISASAHRSATVRGKLVAWYRAPVSGPQARALANYYGADPIVGWCHQPNYFAAPIFAEGAIDPISALRHQPVMFDGVPAHMPNRADMKRFKERPAPVPVKDLPPGDEGILVALGVAEEQIGKRFAIAGHLGGIMRKLGIKREACAAILTEWIPASELAPRLKWALGAWDKPTEDVSGEVALRETVGKAHADVIVAACIAARRSTRKAGAK